MGTKNRTLELDLKVGRSGTKFRIAAYLFSIIFGKTPDIAQKNGDNSSQKPLKMSVHPKITVIATPPNRLLSQTISAVLLRTNVSILL